MTRFVPLRPLPSRDGCRYCGTMWGMQPDHTGHVACPPTTCLACGSRQCMGNGLGHGTCSICYIGLLPGWSGTDRPCSYKGCNEKAIALVGHGSHAYRCRTHLERGKYLGYVSKRLAERGSAWVETQEP